MPTPKPPAMTEEERKARRRESSRKYREANPNKVRESSRKYRQANPPDKEKERDRQRNWRNANQGKLRRKGLLYRKANKDKKKEYDYLYNQANKEKIKERQRAWSQSNQDKLRERKRLYCKANREKKRGYDCVRYNVNREQVLERRRQYHKANPERAREGNRRRRALKMRATFPGLPRTTSLAVALRRQLFNNSCAYCGGPGPFHDDHVEPLSRGGLDTPSNLVPACQRCNLSKNARPVEVWYLSQPFFCPDRWAALKRHTGRKWSEVEQLTLLEQHP